MRHPRACPHTEWAPELPGARGRLPAGCLQPWLPTKAAVPCPGAPTEQEPPPGHGALPALLTTSMAMCRGTGEQKPGFDHRDDKTLDKALCLPPKALPGLCRHQELDHRAPKATGECNYPCLADGKDDLAAQAAQEPDLLAPSSVCSPRQQPPSKPVALPSPSAPGSWELRAHNGPVLMGVGLLASSVVAPASPWHLFGAAQFPEILIIIFKHFRYLTRKYLILLNGKRYHLEPTPGDSPAPGMCNKGFGGCQHT